MTFQPQGFDEHIRRLKFRQGEHVFISGGTGSGKTTLAREVLEKRSHVITFGIKVRDKTLGEDFKDWTAIKSLDEYEPWMDRILLWPKLGRRNKSGNALVEHQIAVIEDALDRLYMSNGWCIFIDEVNFLCNISQKLKRTIERMHYVMRSSDVSLVTAAQRPAWVPMAILSNSAHVYIARTKLEQDLKRLSDMSNVDVKETARAISQLPTKHDFLYTPTQGEGMPSLLNTRKR